MSVSTSHNYHISCVLHQPYLGRLSKINKAIKIESGLNYCSVKLLETKDKIIRVLLKRRPKNEDRRSKTPWTKTKTHDLKRRPRGLKRRPYGLKRRPHGLKRRPRGWGLRFWVFWVFRFFGPVLPRCHNWSC